MDPSHQQAMAFGQNADAHNAAWNQRPALEMVGSDELKNLERVLMMNWSTMQQPQAQPQPQPQPPLSDSLQLNPYLLQMMQVQATQQQSSVPTIPVQTMPVQQSPPQPRHAAGRSANNGGRNDQSQQQQAFQPVIQYPFVPFWTACPLPFSPLAYPQIIMPPSAMAPQQIGPQLLRPINWQQMPMPNFQAPPQMHRNQSSPSQPSTPQSTSTASSTPIHTPLLPQSTPGTPAYFGDKKSEYEEKLERYREKRMKRKWSRAPDQRLSQAAQNRSRDENGKFTCDGKVVAHFSDEASQKAAYLQKQLDELKEQLSRSQFESKLLREKLVYTERELGVLRTNQPTPKAIPDDMYQRQVVAHAQMPQACQGDLFACAEDGIIYSPFKGGNAILAPFKEKVDFSQKKQDLRPINSPFLQVGKDTFLSSIFDTSRMDVRGSGEGSDGEREYEDQERRLEREFERVSQEQWIEEFLELETPQDGEEMNYNDGSYYSND
jgi:hypothetical protein